MTIALALNAIKQNQEVSVVYYLTNSFLVLINNFIP